MTIDDQIEDENYSMTLIGKLQKHQPDHQAKLASLDILQVKKYYLLIIEGAKFTYCVFGKKF